MTPLDIQVGGEHYKLPVQPVEFTMKNGLNFLEGCIVKRLCRYRRPGGKGLQDLEKIRHELALLEYFYKQAGHTQKPPGEIIRDEVERVGSWTEPKMCGTYNQKGEYINRD